MHVTGADWSTHKVDMDGWGREVGSRIGATQSMPLFSPLYHYFQAEEEEEKEEYAWYVYDDLLEAMYCRDAVAVAAAADRLSRTDIDGPSGNGRAKAYMQ